MSLHRIETMLRRMLAEHEAGERDGNPEVARAHEVLARMLREDLEEIDRLRCEHDMADARVGKRTTREDERAPRPLNDSAECDFAPPTWCPLRGGR